jgi:hypothetical protein
MNFSLNKYMLLNIFNDDHKHPSVVTDVVVVVAVVVVVVRSSSSS